MSDRNSSSDERDSVEQAMNEVLRAERDARQAIGDCEREAYERVSTAQQRAQRIAGRTDERITTIHQHCKQWVNREIRALEHRHRSAQQVELSSYIDETALTAAVDELAVMLTGSGSSVTATKDDSE
jgi:vacuolar-type H+-ATPase subunit H